jgi:eukaryotic-like serine/threonine-protein kinase
VRQPIPFGKYLLLERISVGGMAEVFKAKSFGVEGFEKIIAIKRILPTMVEDADFIQMFIDEAKIAGQLSHANICQIFELGKINESHFIAMEFIWGKDLLQIQNRFRKLRLHMPVSMAAFIAAKMCEGLDYAHKKKDARGNPLHIVHRDVSPQNILVSYEGEIKLIDFGIAKAATRSSKTQAGVLKGKFGYMSPEQVRGLPLDRRSDLFALGTILYELLTGERLFLGESDFSTLEKVRNADIQPPSRHNRNVPPALEKIVMKALAKEPEDRFQWANELQEELLSFVMGVPPVFTAKQLSAWMKEAFAPELARERQLLEQYKRLGRDGIIAGKPAAENTLTVEQGLGQAPPPAPEADRTELNPPTFEDLSAELVAAVPEVLTGPTLQAVKALPPGKPPAPARNPKPAGSGFGDEAPTEIFGEVESKPIAVVLGVPRESTVILPTASTAAPAPAAGTPPTRSSGSVAVPAASPPPRATPPAGARASAPVAVPATPMPPPPQPTPLPPAPVPFGAGAPPAASAFGPPAVPASVASTRPRLDSRMLSRGLMRDLGIGAGVAVLVLGLVVGGRFVLGGSRPPVVVEAAPAGTIVVAAADRGGGEVYVNGEKRGDLVPNAEPMTLDGLDDGNYEITVKRGGVPDCKRSLRLDARHPEVVICHFEPPPVAHGKLVLHLATVGATVLVDNQEISAEAASEPLELAPRVEHTITVQREGYVPQQLRLVLAEGESQERTITLEPVPEPKRSARPPKPKSEPEPEQAPAPTPVAATPDAAPAASEEVGYLIANTTPYAKVLIDAHDTGKMTPIAPRAKIPLKPGKHTVTFVVGEDSFDYPIVIEAGRDHRLIKTLPVE